MASCTVDLVSMVGFVREKVVGCWEKGFGVVVE